MIGRPLDAIAVVIPARDEADRLDACLWSVRVAATRVPGVTVHPVLVLDSCADDSASIAASHPKVHTIEIDAGNVGTARATGIEYALSLGVDPSRLWLASTDADGTVPPTWLATHGRAARAGWDALVGAVLPRFDELDPERLRVWHATHFPGSTLGHVHGANLGVRASQYLAVGGYPPFAENEDTELVARLRRAGSAILDTEDDPVTTSARLVGRAERGYASYLDALGA